MSGDAGNTAEKQLAKSKGIRDDSQPSAETLFNRHRFDEGLRRGLLQAAKNNSPLPEWMLRRKSYDRVGEFFVRLKAELVAPERRDQAKIKRMLDELRSSQQQGATQHISADDAMLEQDVAHIEEADEEDIEEVVVKQPTKGMHQHLTGDKEHVQSSTQLKQQGMRRGLLKAAENGTLPTGWIQDRSAASLGDFWVRLKEELLSTERDQARIRRMLDDLRASELQGAEAADAELGSAREQEEAEEESSEERRHDGNCESEVKIQGHQNTDDDDSDDDVFVRWPRGRRRLLTRHPVEEEL